MEQATQVDCVQSVKNVVRAQKILMNPSISRVIESRNTQEENGSGTIEDSFALEFDSQNLSGENSGTVNKEKYLLEEIEEFVNKL